MLRKELQLYDYPFSFSKLTKYIKDNPNITFFCVTENDSKLFKESILNLKYVTEDKLLSREYKYYPCAVIYPSFVDVPKVLHKQDRGVVKFMEYGTLTKVHDDNYVELKAGGYIGKMNVLVNDIYNYETYVMGDIMASYPLSREVIRRFDKIIIISYKFDVSHYRHFIEQYNIKVTRISSWQDTMYMII